jgi:hypothetical protein
VASNDGISVAFPFSDCQIGTLSPIEIRARHFPASVPTSLIQTTESLQAPRKCAGATHHVILLLTAAPGPSAKGRPSETLFAICAFHITIGECGCMIRSTQAVV